MPRRPLIACQRPGCAGKAVGAYTCAKHKRELRKPASQRGYGARHRKWRAVILARDPICVDCERRKSTVADHIVPIDAHDPWGRPELWLIANGAGMCKTCHDRKTQRECRGNRASA